MAPTVKLVYFGIEGKGEVIRLMLSAGKVQFEDKRLPGLQAQEWLDMKDSLPFGTVPVLYWDGAVIAQTQAIIRFIAKKTGLAGNTDLEFAYADMIGCSVEELLGKWLFSRFPPSEEARIENSTNLLKVILPQWLAKAEAMLKSRGGEWFACSGLSFGDIAVVNVLTFMMHPKEVIFKGMNNESERASLLDPFPLLKAHYARVNAVPEIAAWNNNKAEFIGL